MLLLLLTQCILNAYYTLITLRFSVWLGIPVERAVVNNGPRLFTLKALGVPVDFNSIPLSSYVVHVGQDVWIYGKMKVRLMLLASPLIILIIGGIISNISVAVILKRYCLGIIYPTTVGVDNILKWWNLADVRPVEAMGVMAVCFGMVNLMPLPIANGGQILLSYFPKGSKNYLKNIFIYLGAVISLGVVLMWIISIYSAFLG